MPSPWTISTLAAALAATGLPGAAAVAANAETPPEAATPQGESNDWPCWRGARGDNRASEPHPPVRWSAEGGIVWKALIPGMGHASPCIVGDRIFIASADEGQGVQLLVAYDRRSGKELWRTEVHRAKLPKINAKNSHASATPASDGRLIFTLFAQADRLSLSAIDFAGNIAWQQVIGRYRHANGLGASPVLFDELVIVASDNPAEPQLVGLRRADGQVAWRTGRPASDNSATPIVATVAGRPQLIINGAFGLDSHDPATGHQLWHVTHQTEVAACTAACGERVVVASGNVPEACMLAVRADGAGDVTASHLLWKTRQANPYVPSPLAANDRLFLVTDAGVAYCRELETGKIIWKERLGGSFSASPLLAGGNLYASSEEGVTYVFKAADQFSLIAKNDLGERCLASPIICGGRAFIRSMQHLYCIDDTESSTNP
ncbi:MAG: PQQ-binding-like beta-propeller repeat protein [Pirellulales bacterium]|nr:PQQ-binding-like beta-propeller repeat protein [Pirellulales bacterium]